MPSLSEIEKKVSKRLLLFIMPAVLFGFVDRVNISYAAPTMNPALGITPVVFGWGSGIFFIGYLLFEIPSNLVLNRFGARLWIPSIMVVWGALSASVSLASGSTAFLTLRFLLGLAEAGLLPGLMLYASFWVPQNKLGLFTSLMLFMAPIAGAITAFVSGLLLSLEGREGLAGWQWLFLCEGVPAIFLGLAGFQILDSRPENAGWLSPEEKLLLAESLAKSGGRPASQRGGAGLSVVRNGRMWTCAASYFCMNLALGAQPWLPMLGALHRSPSLQISLILGFANGLAAISMVLWARSSDLRAERHNHFLMAALASVVGWSICGAGANSLGLLSVGIVLALGGMYAALAIFWTLAPLFLSTSEKPIGIALVTCVGLSGGVLSPIVTGYFRQMTGHYDFGMYLAAAGILLAPLVTRTIGRAYVPSEAVCERD